MTPEIKITKAALKDAAELYALQKLAYISEAKIYNDYTIPPLAEPLEETVNAFKTYIVLKAVLGKKIVGSVRGELTEDYIYVGRLMVHPDFQGHGLGTRLMKALEAEFPHIKKFVLGTGHKSERNLHLYHKLDYKDTGSRPQTDRVTMIMLEKIIP